MIEFSKIIRDGAIRSWLGKGSAPFWALCLLVVACFALGGSARGDVASLILLRPVAVVLLGLGLWRLPVWQVKAHRFLFAMALATIALPALQLIPLPPAIWNHLPGRGLAMEIDRVAGLGGVWRPLSMTPAATWNAFYAALVPGAALVLGIQLNADEQRRLLALVLTLCGISALLGLMQILGNPEGPRYFYRITNNGYAVGLFANRNHQALLLAMMLPMLAVMARDKGVAGGARKLAAPALGLVLLPLILITGSRSGLIVTALAIVSIPLILGYDRAVAGEGSVSEAKRSRMMASAGRIGLALTGTGLVGLTVWLGRDLAWDRFFISETAGELRLNILPTLASMIVAYAPAGSGMGSFERVYQIHEPDALLRTTYMNHAHNDWLEVLLNGGAAAAVLLLVALTGLLLQLKRAFSVPVASAPGVQYSRLGLVMVLLTAVASVTDYPLRVPSLSVLFALAVVWASCSLPKIKPMSGIK